MESENYIFEILDLLDSEAQNQTAEVLYSTLRGIFLRNLHKDEELGLSHEDFILIYLVTVLHPDLPVFIRDKYVNRIGTSQRIIDFKSEIFLDLDKFCEEEDNKDNVSKCVDKVDHQESPEHEFKEVDIFQVILISYKMRNLIKTLL